MNKYASFSFGLLTLIVIFSFSTSILKSEITEPPVFKKGTFWKIKNEQLADALGNKIDRSVNVSCYIDRETIYNGVEVYEATFIIHEEKPKDEKELQ